ncbi:MAG: ABC transporter substrate-binding protein, partial [Myxococcaceae bacterium]
MVRSIVAAAVLALLGGCPGCKDKPGAATPKDPVARASAPEGWLRGELPREVNEGTPVSGGTFTVRVYSEPSGLNRLHDQMAEGWMYKYTNGTLYETLAELDRDSHPRYELKPLLAESWELSPDHLTNTVHLRKGVRFHNGEPFSS